MIAKKENQKITFLKTALSLPLVLLLLLTFSIQFQSVAQDNDAPEQQYVTIVSPEPISAEEKEETIQKILKANKSKGIHMTRDHIIFKTGKEAKGDNSLLIEAHKGNSPLPPSDFQFKLDKSSRQVKVFLNGKEVEVYEYVFSYTEQLGPRDYSTKTISTRGNKIPDDFVFGNYAKVFVGEFKLGKNGKNKSYDHFYHEITDDCN